LAWLSPLALADYVGTPNTYTWYVNTDAVSNGDGSAESPFNNLNTGLGTVDNTYGDLTATTSHHTFYVYGATASTDGIWLGGFTNSTNDNYHVHVICSDPHSGVWTTGKFRVQTSGSIAFNGAPAYTRIQGLQIKTTAGSGIGINLSATGYVISNCIIKDCYEGVYGYSSKGCTIENCIITGGTYGYWAKASSNIINTTFANCATYGLYSYGYIGIATRNVYSGGCGTDLYTDGSGTWNKYNTYTEDGSLSTSTVAFTTSTFTNVTAGSENMHLVAGSGLIGVGADTSSYTLVDTDVDGDTRPQGDTWDVGADELFEADDPEAIYATGFFPADEATKQNRTVKLAWVDDPNAVSHDLFGGTNPASLSQLQDASTQEWYVVKNLTPGVPYYWRVDEIDSESNTTTGVLLEFTPTGKAGSRQ